MTVAASSSAAPFFEDLRAREFPALDRDGVAYLDYTGAALPARSQLRAAARALEASVLGNPHSLHGPSRRSTEWLDAVRRRTLELVGADPGEWEVCFTANATGAIRLVGEAFPFGPGSTLALAADNHNSVNGISVRARERGAAVCLLPLDDELRLDRPLEHLPAPDGPSLLAFPAQSNFSGVRHPLDVAVRARELGYRVLLDAAAFVPSASLDLGTAPVDFACISYYKIFGHPTGVGALVARREALAELHRPWFAGGSVEFVSVRHGLHRPRDGAGGFEDGTPPFDAAPALEAGFDLVDRVGRERLARHVADLTRLTLDGLTALRRPDGGGAVRTHGPLGCEDRGGTVAFDVLGRDRAPVPYERVEAEAAAAGLAIRGGCFCNPGASAAAFGVPAEREADCLADMRSGPFSPARLSRCLGRPVGALRASFGASTLPRDVERLVDLVERVAALA